MGDYIFCKIAYSDLINNLKARKEVDAVFITGSFATLKTWSASDLDLVVVLNKNTLKLQSVYEKINSIFADIFFFDKTDLKRLLRAKKLDGNSMDGILLSWIQKADIKFDKSGLLTKIKRRASKIHLFVSNVEKRNILQRISYNYNRNERYFKSKNKKYLEALNILLMDSVIELIIGFLTLRDKPWRGEKDAIAFIEKQDPAFKHLFLKLNRSMNIESKMKIYKKMVKKVLPKELSLYSYEEPVCISKNRNTKEEMDKLNIFWNRISGKTIEK
jgi:predicted nucleotidyltransferase